MKHDQPPSAHGHRLRGWLIPAALLALSPKCVLCLLAYAGIAGALSFGGPELCGATDNATGYWTMGLLVAGGTLGLVGIFGRWRRHA